MEIPLGTLANTGASSTTLDKEVEYELNRGRRLGPDMDIKKLRRIISNRLSAKKSRMKKCQYIKDMEKMVNHLQEEISILTPQVESYKKTRKILVLENDSLQRLVEIRSSQSKLQELELEGKKSEINKLKEVEKLKNKRVFQKQQFSGTSFVQSELKIKESFSFVQRTTSEKNQDETNIDQYLNFEAMNLHPMHLASS